MARPVAKLLVGFFILAALLVVVEVVLTLSQPAPTPPPLPKPNGYDDFVQAGGMLAENTSEYTSMSKEELQALVGKNANALKLARTGLTRACQVPLNYSPTDSAWIERLSHIKRLALAIAATGRLAQLENRPAEAAEAYVTVIRLGSAISRGGVLIDSLVSIAIEAIGTSGLEKVVPTLDAKQCREVVGAIESCESRREPMKVILARERAWTHRSYGLRGWIYRGVQFPQVKQFEQRTTAKVQAQHARLRRLLIELAARAYELEKGERPKTLGELVPAYLKAIPKDPVTGTNMTYYP